MSDTRRGYYGIADNEGKFVEADEALEYALTFGLEHTFEAVRESVPDEALLEIYEHLSSEVDYLFDLEKHKALKRLWSSGVKDALRTNPG